MDEELRKLERRAAQGESIDKLVSALARTGVNETGEAISEAELQSLIEHIAQTEQEDCWLEHYSTDWPTYREALNEINYLISIADQYEFDDEDELNEEELNYTDYWGESIDPSTLNLHELEQRKKILASQIPRKDGCILIFNEWDPDNIRDYETQLAAEQSVPERAYEVWKIKGTLHYAQAEPNPPALYFWNASIELFLDKIELIMMTSKQVKLIDGNNIRNLQPEISSYPTSPAHVLSLPRCYSTYKESHQETTQ